MSIAREMRALGIAGIVLNVTEDGQVTQPRASAWRSSPSTTWSWRPATFGHRKCCRSSKRRKEARVQRIVITHPEFPTTLLSIEHQQELAKHGVYFERCFTTPNTGKISWEQVYANIRQVGPESTILATDLGQSTAPYPDEGLGTFMGDLLDNGFSEARGPGMVRDNPAQVLGAKTAAATAA